MNEAILRKLIPVWVDHNNKFHVIKDYFVHEDTGTIWSSKKGQLRQLKPCTNRGKQKGKHSYPFITLIDPIFEDLYEMQKTVMLHRVLKISYVLHYNLFIEEFAKIFTNVAKEDLLAIPRSIQEQILRGLEVNHIDHNKLNHNYNNLEFTTAQENSKSYKNYKKNTL